MPFRITKRSMLKRSCILLLLVQVLACSGSETETLSPVTPSPAAPSTPTTFTLERTSHHQPYEGPHFRSNRVRYQRLRDAGRSATTDTSGNFSFTEMQQSSVIVDVSAVEYFSTRAPLASNQTQTIFLVPLGPVIQLSGQVIDDGTSAPIAAATVDINGRYRTTTDASGKYSLTGRLDIGESSITYAFADGYETHTRYIRGNSAQQFSLTSHRANSRGAVMVCDRPPG